MSVFKGLSKEFQVGALTSIAITILILGYNYMRGNDNPFKAGTDVYVFYDSAQGLGVGTSVMYNGLRIGQLSAIGISDDGSHIKTRFEIKAALNIPKDSKLEIQSQIFGGQKVRLIMGMSSQFIDDGDTLIGVYAHDQFSTLNDQMVPLVSKADSMLTGLNNFFQNPGLTQSLETLPRVMKQLEMVLLRSQSLLEKNDASISNSVANVEMFTSQLTSYHARITPMLQSFEKVSKGMDSVDMVKTMKQLESMVQSSQQILQQLEEGKGSMGIWLKSDSTANTLQRNLLELNRILLDLKKYPEKYVPVPFTKKQRNKAKAASLNDSEVWPK